MSTTKKEPESPIADRDLYSGLIRLDVLHHATEEPMFGLGMIEELNRHGYRMSPGSLYPLLHGLEKKGYLRVTDEYPTRTPSGEQRTRPASFRMR